jgi:hypothetical protein
MRGRCHSLEQNNRGEAARAARSRLGRLQYWFATVNGVRIHYVAGGNPDGALVVLWPVSKKLVCWRKLMKQLAPGIPHLCTGSARPGRLRPPVRRLRHAHPGGGGPRLAAAARDGPLRDDRPRLGDVGAWVRHTPRCSAANSGAWWCWMPESRHHLAGSPANAPRPSPPPGHVAFRVSRLTGPVGVAGLSQSGWPPRVINSRGLLPTRSASRPRTKHGAPVWRRESGPFRGSQKG